MAHMKWYKPVEESHELKWYDQSLVHNPNHYGHGGGYVMPGSHQGYSNSYGNGQYPGQSYGQHMDGKNHGQGQSSHGLLGGKYSSQGTGFYGNPEKKHGHKEKHNHGYKSHGHGHGDSSGSDSD